jgi:pyruvate-formate lyase-activating enzyme
VGAVHLIDILSLRPVPAAGLFLTLTRRCPLSCAHCSTNSMLSSGEHAADIFVRLVDSFTAENRPDLLLLTGGEPLLRPRLVQSLTERAHAVGARVSLISGMFFARQPEIPPLIARAIDGVDHFTASLDVFHEQQVARAAVFRVLRTLVDAGKDVSLQVVGMGEQDPYLADVIGDIRRTFDDRVPVLVGQVHAAGRARDWLREELAPADTAPLPCVMAAWPVVTFDGTVVGCCNQDVVDGPVPPHLRIGHAAEDDWATIRERYLTSNMMRAIRTFGPEYVADQYGSGKIACDGYCSTCYRLSDDPGISERLQPALASPGIRVVEKQVEALQREYFPSGIPQYEPLRWLGYAPRR